MNIILLQGQLTLQEIDLLLREFPQYLFLSLSEAAYKNLSPDHWSRLEVLYGSRLTKEELEMAHQLRWIHSPSLNLNRLCLEEIEKRGNILITTTIEENSFQIGEFAMGALLAYAKNLFHWKASRALPTALWNSKWRDNAWSLKNKVFLQIGLGNEGTEIARRAKELKMRVWGMHQGRSFHPYCHQTFPLKELQAVLPQADVVCIALPKGKEYYNLFKREELELMKQDSILMIFGASHWVQETALAEVAASGKFRGILLDAYYQYPLPLHSPLWRIPELLITPEVAPRPKSTERQAFRTFLYNLRQYSHANFNDMRNALNPVLE